MGIRELPDLIRRRVIRSATSPFGHADYPLVNTLDYRGDAGLFGPGAASWQVIGDVAAFAGGIRALLIQAAHPEVVAGVEDHSRYREDPLGRLSRTSAYVTATTYGAMPEVEAAVAMVRGAHRGVAGSSHRGRYYSAASPAHAAWVHNVLTDSFLSAYRAFGPQPLEPGDDDRFVREQAVIGRMLDADPVPETASELAGWVADHPDLGTSPGMQSAVEFLVDPPLSPGQKAGYKLLAAAAISTMPDRIREILGLSEPVAGELAGKATLRFLRWALGSSPSWQIALMRCGAPIPPDKFTQRPVLEPG
ncbi:MAG: oxygenase MpaB family protein [Acidimicrobiia bacterium]